MLSIPIISPIDVMLTGPGVRMLPPPDYEIQSLPPAMPEPESAKGTDPVATALDEIELAARVSEYHDFAWWSDRINTIRASLQQDDAT